MSKEEALAIAREYGLQEEVQECLDQDFTPEEALIEWDID